MINISQTTRMGITQPDDFYRSLGESPLLSSVEPVPKLIQVAIFKIRMRTSTEKRGIVLFGNGFRKNQRTSALFRVREKPFGAKQLKVATWIKLRKSVLTNQLWFCPPAWLGIIFGKCSGGRWPARLRPPGSGPNWPKSASWAGCQGWSVGAAWAIRSRRRPPTG